VDSSFRPFRTSSDADLAFAVVVLASYFTTFSIMGSATTAQLLWMIGLGVGYIAIGIYGYAYVVRSGKSTYHLAYFLVQFLLGGMIVYLGEGVGYNAMVLLPLAGHSVVLLPRNMRLVINIALVATYALALNPLATSWGVVWSGLPLFMAGQIFIVVFTQMAVSEEKARAEVEKLVKDLEDANQRLRIYAMQIEELATTKERNRLAREIHDGLGHYLTTIHMQIQAARAVMDRDPGKAYEAMGTAQSQTQEALLDVRRSVFALRDLPGDSLTLEEEIEKMLKSCEGAGISAEIKILGAPRSLSPQSLLTIFRTVQEGINNSVKHAHPNRISVTLDYTQSQQVRLTIQDDGVGATKLDGGFGLLGIRERVHLLHGRVNIVTQPGDGFRLEVMVPG
jgi:signal transduction histidine kinase